MAATRDIFAAAPALARTWMQASLTFNRAIDPTLLHLVEIRASQINGCANCLNLHTTSAREAGETEQRLNLLAAWREAPCYTDRERAALGWTDALTRLSEDPDLETAREQLAAHFSEEEQVKLSMVIIAINGWNRLAVGFKLWADPAQVSAQAAALATDQAEAQAA